MTEPESQNATTRNGTPSQGRSSRGRGLAGEREMETMISAAPRGTQRSPCQKKKLSVTAWSRRRRSVGMASGSGAGLRCKLVCNGEPGKLLLGTKLQQMETVFVFPRVGADRKSTRLNSSHRT